MRHDPFLITLSRRKGMKNASILAPLPFFADACIGSSRPLLGDCAVSLPASAHCSLGLGFLRDLFIYFLQQGFRWCRLIFCPPQVVGAVESLI